MWQGGEVAVARSWTTSRDGTGHDPLLILGAAAEVVSLKEVVGEWFVRSGSDGMARRAETVRYRLGWCVFLTWWQLVGQPSHEKYKRINQ